MARTLYNSVVYFSMIIIAVLVVLSIIRRLSAGKKLVERCRQLVVNGTFVTGRLIHKKMTDRPSRKDRDDPYRWTLIYEYTVNGIVYTTKKRYESERRNRKFPDDPKIYFDPEEPGKGYVEAEPDVYTGGHAVKTVIKAAFLLGLYWVVMMIFVAHGVLGSWLQS